MTLSSEAVRMRLVDPSEVNSYTPTGGFISAFLKRKFLVNE
jgi:hypothetical protein